MVFIFTAHPTLAHSQVDNQRKNETGSSHQKATAAHDPSPCSGTHPSTDHLNTAYSNTAYPNTPSQTTLLNRHQSALEQSLKEVYRPEIPTPAKIRLFQLQCESNLGISSNRNEIINNTNNSDSINNRNTSGSINNTNNSNSSNKTNKKKSLVVVDAQKPLLVKQTGGIT